MILCGCCGEPDNYYDAFSLCFSKALRHKLNLADILIENWRKARNR
jgi:type III restriction enzyme